MISFAYIIYLICCALLYFCWHVLINSYCNICAYN